MALRTGTDYLNGLRDGREVYLDGRRVTDVTSEPGFSAVAHTFARMYDLVLTSQETMSVREDDGRRVSLSWIRPRNRDDLARRRSLTELIARHTGGLFGRPQDYVPLFHLGMLDFKHELSLGNARFERNIEDYWFTSGEKDLMLSHGVADIQSHPSIPLDKTTVPRVVARKSDGIVVRGVKAVATFAAHADEIFIASSPRSGTTEDRIMYFSIPIATPGLKVVARTPYGSGSEFNHPVSRYGDELDCIVILDDVLVPWERVFSLGGDPNAGVTVFKRISEWAHWSILPRLAVKAEVLAGLYALIPAMMGRDDQPQAQEAQAEVIRYLTTLRAFIHAAEDRGFVTPSGYYMPNPSFVSAGRAYSVEHYRRITSYLHDISSQTLINMPSEEAFKSAEVGPALEGMFASPDVAARDRARVTRLAWDMICDSFGSRQTLFELFNAGLWTAQRMQLLANFDIEPYKRLALATAGVGSLGEAANQAADAARVQGRDQVASPADPASRK